jgi:hypothetical protein
VPWARTAKYLTNSRDGASSAEITESTASAGVGDDAVSVRATGKRCTSTKRKHRPTFPTEVDTDSDSPSASPAPQQQKQKLEPRVQPTSDDAGNREASARLMLGDDRDSSSEESSSVRCLRFCN